MRRFGLRACAVAVALALPAPGAAGAAGPPLVRQMVVPLRGDPLVQSVRAREVRVRAGRRRCAVPAGTALAVLARAELPRLDIRDFGSCSRRPRDAGGLYVRAIGRDRARGSDGWVYKVGNRQASAGAADPSGPFGRGRLRSGTRVTWFYCRTEPDGSCPRSLAMRARREPGGSVAVRVIAHDDEGRGIPAEGATVSAGEASAVTDAAGFARLAPGAGARQLRATKPGHVPSFPERVPPG